MIRFFELDIISTKLGESIYIYFGLFIYIPYNEKISKYYNVSFLCGNCGNRALFLLKYEESAVTTNTSKSYHSEQKNLTANAKKARFCQFLSNGKTSRKPISIPSQAPP